MKLNEIWEVYTIFFNTKTTDLNAWEKNYSYFTSNGITISRIYSSSPKLWGLFWPQNLGLNKKIHTNWEPHPFRSRLKTPCGLKLYTLRMRLAREQSYNLFVCVLQSYKTTYLMVKGTVKAYNNPSYYAFQFCFIIILVNTGRYKFITQ